jgi:hypothetical protein
MARPDTAAAHRRRATGPVSSLTGSPAASPAGPASDIHPVLRRATAPPAALDLLAHARSCLAEAADLGTPNERYAIAHLAALRTAAAVLAARPPEGAAPASGRGTPTRRGRRAAIRSAWELLPESVPELAEWSDRFAASAGLRARAEAGIRGAASDADAEALIRDAAMFLRLAERILGLAPGPPGPRPDGGQPPDRAEPTPPDGAG